VEPVIVPDCGAKVGLPARGPRDLSPFALLVLAVLFLAGAAWPADGSPSSAPPPFAVVALAVLALAGALAAGAGAWIAVAQGRYLRRAVDEFLRRFPPPGGAPPPAPLPPRPPSGPSSASEPTFYVDPANVGDHCGGEGCDPALGTCSCSCPRCHPRGEP
jgi:hypothetical protein